MRVVLVNPNFQPRIRRIAQTSLGPPLGLAYLASAARRDGHEVSIVDANALGLDAAAAAAAALRAGPAVVGLTATTPTIHLAGDIAARIKAVRPDVTVIVGGPHASAIPERTLEEHPAFDVAARGEGEESFPRFLAALAAGGRGALRDVAGLTFRDEDGTLVDTGRAPFITDLDTIAPPARDLLPMARYRCPDADHFSTILAMRGCPCACVYCGVPAQFGTRMRYRSPVAVADEMAEVHARFGIDFFSFVDDTFTTKREWVLDFAAALRARGLTRRVRWICLTRADMVDPALLVEMRAAGCVRVEFGIESGSAVGRRFLKKGLAPEAVLTAFRAARAAGLSTMGFAILNIPGEGPREVEETFELVRQADPDFLQVSFLTPYPGTPLRRQAEREGWVVTDDWSQYSFLNNVVMRHDTASAEALQQRYLAFVRRFWLRPGTVWKLGRLVLGGGTRLVPLARTAVLGLAAALLDRGKGRA